jgi:hypothetical protein
MDEEDDIMRSFMQRPDRDVVGLRKVWLRLNPVDPRLSLRLKEDQVFPKWPNLASDAAVRRPEHAESIVWKPRSPAEARSGYEPLSRILQRSFIHFDGMCLASFLTALSG